MAINVLSVVYPYVETEGVYVNMKYILTPEAVLHGTHIYIACIDIVRLILVQWFQHNTIVVIYICSREVHVQSNMY